jgi:hypothetical protein
MMECINTALVAGIEFDFSPLSLSLSECSSESEKTKVDTKYFVAMLDVVYIYIFEQSMQEILCWEKYLFLICTSL